MFCCQPLSGIWFSGWLGFSADFFRAVLVECRMLKTFYWQGYLFGELNLNLPTQHLIKWMKLFKMPEVQRLDILSLTLPFFDEGSQTSYNCSIHTTRGSKVAVSCVRA